MSFYPKSLPVNSFTGEIARVLPYGWVKRIFIHNRTCGKGTALTPTFATPWLSPSNQYRQIVDRFVLPPLQIQP